MVDQIKIDYLFMDIAHRISKMSYDTREKVGGLLVNHKNIISFGWNGMPSGFDNHCQDNLGITKPEVLHAEQNIYAKLASTGGLAKGSTLYITLSPCFECAKLIIQSKTKQVIYDKIYRDTKPLIFLKNAGVKVKQIGEI